MTPEGMAGAPPPGFALGQQPPGMAPALNLQDNDVQAEGEVDPLAALQDAIHAVVGAMHALTDPQDTQDAAKALVQLAAIQTRVMSKGAPAGQ